MVQLTRKQHRQPVTRKCAGNQEYHLDSRAQQRREPFGTLVRPMDTPHDAIPLRLTNSALPCQSDDPPGVSLDVVADYEARDREKEKPVGNRDQHRHQ